MTKSLKIFIGYDKDEAIAYHVLAHSIMKHASVPVSITPLIRKQLPIGHRDHKASTDFADTRFLVPYLCDYKGWALFIDSDMLVTTDIKNLFDMADERYTVMVRQHDYNPTKDTKFLNQTQYKYAKKNWSSMMLFNCEKCTSLTPLYVNKTHGLKLHQFAWCELYEIGDLPKGWNYLVGHDEWDHLPYLIHYTEGTPCFKDYEYCEHAELWKEYKKEAEHVGD